MVDLVAIAVVAVGVLFLFFGSTFSSYGVSAMGVLVGGSGGYLLGPSLAGMAGISPLAATAGAVLVGAAVGFALSAMFLSMAMAAIAFVVGTYLGWTVIAGIVLEGGSMPLEVGVAVLVGLVAAGVGSVFSSWMLVLLTSFVGAAMASRSVTATDVADVAATFDPEPLLFDATAPLFVGLFVLGILVQFGLIKFGYVTKLLTVIPGIRPLRERSA